MYQARLETPRTGSASLQVATLFLVLVDIKDTSLHGILYILESTSSLSVRKHIYFRLNFVFSCNVNALVMVSRYDWKKRIERDIKFNLLNWDYLLRPVYCFPVLILISLSNLSGGLI